MKAKRLTLCALFAALTAVCAQVVLPLGPVPVNLALLPVMVCAALLPVQYAVTSAVVYLLMGLIGLPVFSRMTGGPGVLFGITGGYLLGYVLCAWVVAALCQNRVKPWLAMGMGVLACYAAGAAWQVLMGHVSFEHALGYGVLPFIPGDVLKIAAANGLAKRLYLVVRA